jgi:uncharacterized protein (DUF427 family)
MTIKRITPGPGQESVWDYPRPAILEESSKRIRVVANGVTIVDSTFTKRVLETSHPPVYYIPPQDIETECLVLSPSKTFCEWKGEAEYYTVLAGGERFEKAGWFYSDPKPRFADIAGYVAFYPSKMEACYVDEEKVQAQEGDFYGGWITSDIVGPFKGPRGTFGW